MDLDKIAVFIKDVGFPVFVAMFVLWRLEPTIAKLTNTLRVLTGLIAEQQGQTLEHVEKRYGNGR